MDNELGKIKTPPKTTAPQGGGDPPAGADKSLPDPTKFAKWALGALFVAALIVAWGWNHFGNVGTPFVPAKESEANFALFAGFYAAAQVIERLLELISPTLPFWDVPDPPTPGGPASEVQMATAKAAQVKADRAAAAHGIAAVLGVGASCAFGLFLLQAIGFHVSNTIDTFSTGIVIGAGTKPLHDFISGLQNKNTPTTGTTA
jgi:hypothetical protein